MGQIERGLKVIVPGLCDHGNVESPLAVWNELRPSMLCTDGILMMVNVCGTKGEWVRW